MVYRHGMDAPIPAIEVAHTADSSRVGCPYRKSYAVHAGILEALDERDLLLCGATWGALDLELNAQVGGLCIHTASADRSARIALTTIEGDANVSGDSFRSTFGLRSTWWTVTSAPAKSAWSYPKDLDGNARGDLLGVDTSGTLRLLSGSGIGTFTAQSIPSGRCGVFLPK